MHIIVENAEKINSLSNDSVERQPATPRAIGPDVANQLARVDVE